MKERIKIL
jgi:hypothetical protein